MTSVAKAKRCNGVYSVFLRGMVLIFAIVFLLLGILGFIPAFTPNHILFSFFSVGIFLNIFYILIGLLVAITALYLGFTSKVLRAYYH